MNRILVTLFCLSSVAMAVPEYVPIAEKASGQSLGGAHLTNDSLYSNPAGASFSQVYSVEGIWQMPRSYSVSVIDTKTSSFGGALGYFRRVDAGSSTPFQGIKVGFSGRLTNEFGVGLSGKSVWGQDDFGNNTRLTDMDLGTLYSAGFLQMGLSLRNALGGNPNLKQQDREWLVGARVNYKQVLFLSSSVATKWNVPTRPYQYSFGAEYVSPYYFAFMGGYRVIPTTTVSQAYWSGGIGFAAPKLAAHYSVEFPSQPQEKIEHAVSLSFLF